MRDALKALARALATIAATPALLSYAVRRPVLGRDRALEGSSQALAIVPGIAGEYLRRAFLARVLDGCAASATIQFGTLFSQAGARVDARVYVGPRCHLGLVHLEQDVLLAAGVHVPSGGATHGIADPDRPIRDQPGTRQLVRIGAGTWVGSAAIVMADVGRHCVIGAGSVVTRPIPDYSIAAGVPATVVHSRKEVHQVHQVKQVQEVQVQEVQQVQGQEVPQVQEVQEVQQVQQAREVRQVRPKQ